MARITQPQQSIDIPVSQTTRFDGKPFVVVKYGGTFHLQPIRDFPHEHDGVMIYTWNNANAPAYVPAHPSMTKKDIEESSYAVDDGTYWHFYKATAGDHHILEASVEALLIAHFQPRINAQSMKVHRAADITARTLEANKLEWLQTVMDDALNYAENEVRGLWLGQHIQEGKSDFARETASGAVVKALVKLTETAKTSPIAKFNQNFVETEANKVVSSLTTRPTVETRIQRAARLAAEAAAAEKAKKEAETPAEGSDDESTGC